MIYELRAYNTDSRYSEDIRYREYTSSKRRADAFNMIPKIQFTGSGHGICFGSWPHKGHRFPRVYMLADYVQEHMALLLVKPARTDWRQKAFIAGAKWAMEECRAHVGWEESPVLRGMCRDCLKKMGSES